jgi:hypothetical protein
MQMTLVTELRNAPLIGRRRFVAILRDPMQFRGLCENVPLLGLVVALYQFCRHHSDRDILCFGIRLMFADVHY